MIENLPVGWDLPKPTQDEVSRIKTEYRLEGKSVLLYTGTFGKNQGLEMTIDALDTVRQTHPNVKAMFVGGVGSDMARIQSLVKLKGMEDIVALIEPRDFREMPAYMEAADILLSPRTDGTNTPLKIYSYMASGKPILATDLPTHTQALDHSMAELVEPTPSAVADGICKILDNSECAEKLGKAAKQKAQSQYGYDRYRRQFESILEQTCNGHVQPTNGQAKIV